MTPSTPTTLYPTSQGAFRCEIFSQKITPLTNTALEMRERIQSGRIELPDLIRQAEELRCSLALLLTGHIEEYRLANRAPWNAISKYSAKLAKQNDYKISKPSLRLPIQSDPGLPLQEISELNYARKALNAACWVVGFGQTMETAICRSYGWAQIFREGALKTIEETIKDKSFSFENQKEFVLTRAFYTYQILCFSSTETSEKKHLSEVGIVFFNNHHQFRPILQSLLATLSIFLSSSH